jgi:hypothetical protein
LFSGLDGMADENGTCAVLGKGVSGLTKSSLSILSGLAVVWSESAFSLGLAVLAPVGGCGEEVTSCFRPAVFAGSGAAMVPSLGAAIGAAIRSNEMALGLSAVIRLWLSRKPDRAAKNATAVASTINAAQIVLRPDMKRRVLPDGRLGSFIRRKYPFGLYNRMLWND